MPWDAVPTLDGRSRPKTRRLTSAPIFLDGQLADFSSVAACIPRSLTCGVSWPVFHISSTTTGESALSTTNLKGRTRPQARGISLSRTTSAA